MTVKRKPEPEHDRLLRSIAHNLKKLVRQGDQIMSLGTDILAQLQATDAKVDGVLALLKSTQANTVTTDEQAAIAAQSKTTQDKLDAANPPA
jgi:hypothetical protein